MILGQSLYESSYTVRPKIDISGTTVKILIDNPHNSRIYYNLFLKSITNTKNFTSSPWHQMRLIMLKNICTCVFNNVEPFYHKKNIVTRCVVSSGVTVMTSKF